MGDGDHSHARVPPGISISGELLQVSGEATHHARFLAELSVGGFLNALIRTDEAAGQGPFALERVVGALDKEGTQQATTGW